MPVHFKPATYVRRPFSVEAIEVTADNMELAAVWCNGKISQGAKRKYIAVPTMKTTNENQNRAFEGFFLVRSTQGFRVYSRKAFFASFMEGPVEVHEDDDYGRVLDKAGPYDDAILEGRKYHSKLSQIPYEVDEK